MSKDNTLRVIEAPAAAPGETSENAQNTRYVREWTPGEAGSNDSLSIVYSYVPAGSFVLDVGCSIGQLGGALKRDKQCRVFGLEINTEAAAHAQKVLDKVIVQDVCITDFKSLSGSQGFDAIIFADVLEHVPGAELILKKASEALSPKGFIIISVPNIAHASVRLALLEGKFEYRKEGLLDETHLKFYTRDSLRDLLDRAGLAAVEVKRTYLGATDTEIPVTADTLITPEFITLVEDLDEATTYQFVLQAVPVTNEYYGHLIGERLHNLENNLIRTTREKRGVLNELAAREKAFQRESARFLEETGRIDSSLRKTQEDLLAVMNGIQARVTDLDRRIMDYQAEEQNRFNRTSAAVRHLASYVQARLGNVEERSRLVSERIERYINIWPLRVLRRLRKRLLRV